MRPGLPIVELVILALVLLLPLGGLAWLIFVRCKFSIGQLLFSLFVFGGLLTLYSDYEIAPRVGWAAGCAVGVLLCMFIGARAAAKIDPRQSLRRWHYFLAGFFVLPSGIMTIPTIIMTLTARMPAARDFWPIAISSWIVAAWSICIVVKSLGMKRFKDSPKSQESGV